MFFDILSNVLATRKWRGLVLAIESTQVVYRFLIVFFSEIVFRFCC